MNGTWNNISFIKNSTETMGEVVDLEASQSEDSDGNLQTYYYPVVEFTDTNGEQHILKSSMGSGRPEYEIGEGIKVLYLPENPSKGKIGTFGHLWGGQLIIWILSIVFLTTGLLIDFFSNRDKRRKKKAEKYSTIVEAKVTEVVYNVGVKVNGRSPFQIHAQWYDEQTNKIWIFKSGNFWFDPSEFLHDTIEIKADATNYKKYWMDTSFIPEMAE